MFLVHALSGLLSIQTTLDRETTPSFTLTIQVRDQGTPQRSAIKLISIHVLDINDHAPLFSQSSYTVDIQENLPPQSNVLQVQATDLDIGEDLVHGPVMCVFDGTVDVFSYHQLSNLYTICSTCNL